MWFFLKFQALLDFQKLKTYGSKNQLLVPFKIAPLMFEGPTDFH